MRAARIEMIEGVKVDDKDVIINISAGRLINGGVAIFDIIRKNQDAAIIGE